MRKTELIHLYSVQELLEEMETLILIKYSGKYGQIPTEITKPQRMNLETLKIESPA